MTYPAQATDETSPSFPSLEREWKSELVNVWTSTFDCKAQMFFSLFFWWLDCCSISVLCIVPQWSLLAVTRKVPRQWILETFITVALKNLIFYVEIFDDFGISFLSRGPLFTLCLLAYGSFVVFRIPYLSQQVGFSWSPSLLASPSRWITLGLQILPSKWVSRGLQVSLSLPASGVSWDPLLTLCLPNDNPSLTPVHQNSWQSVFPCPSGFDPSSDCEGKDAGDRGKIPVNPNRSLKIPGMRCGRPSTSILVHCYATIIRPA